MPTAAPLVCASGSRSQQSGTPTAHRLGSPELAAATVASDSLQWQVGPKAPATQRLGSPMPAVLLHCSPGAHTWKAGPRTTVPQRLGSPMLAAVPVAPGSPVPANRPQGSHCLQTWVPCACSSFHGSWKPTPKCK
jgi:hypothetical protein